MKSTLEKLSKADKQALAHFYDTDSYKALRRLVDLERIELAKDHVDQTDMMLVRYLSGQIQGLKKLILTLKTNYQNLNKDK
jgi:hypothetical protein